MNKIIQISLILSFCLLNQSFAMEQQDYEEESSEVLFDLHKNDDIINLERFKEKERVCYLSELPQDLVKYLISFLVSNDVPENNIVEGIKVLKNLALVNKYFWVTINDKKLIQDFVKIITEKLEFDTIKAVKILGTKSAYDFILDQMNSDQVLVAQLRDNYSEKNSDLKICLGCDFYGLNKTKNTYLSLFILKCNKILTFFFYPSYYSNKKQFLQKILFWSVLTTNEKLFRLAVLNGADVNDNPNNPLLVVAITQNLAEQNKKKGIVKLLLESGTDLKSKNIFGDTALSAAKRLENKEIEELLNQYSS